MAAPEYHAAAQALLRAARRREKKLDEIRHALLEGETARAVRLMRIYTGIDGEANGQESDRPRPSLN